MWDFPGDRTGGKPVPDGQPRRGASRDLAVPPTRDERIAYGPLLFDAAFPGTAVLVPAPDPKAAWAS